MKAAFHLHKIKTLLVTGQHETLVTEDRQITRQNERLQKAWQKLQDIQANIHNLNRELYLGRSTGRFTIAQLERKEKSLEAKIKMERKAMETYEKEVQASRESINTGSGKVPILLPVTREEE